MLKSVLITENNLDLAINIQREIFPRENGKANFLESFDEQKLLPSKLSKEYFLVYKDTNPIGLWGHYCLQEKNEVWLGWFGVVQKERKHGYGTTIFKIFESWAKDNGFDTIRLYTDEVDNAIACKLYEKMGMIKEYYKNKNDLCEDIGNIVIYSKSLKQNPVKLWNSKFIGYKKQKEKENDV